MTRFYAEILVWLDAESEAEAEKIGWSLVDSIIAIGAVSTASLNSVEEDVVPEEEASE